MGSTITIIITENIIFIKYESILCLLLSPPSRMKMNWCLNIIPHGNKQLICFVSGDDCMQKTMFLLTILNIIYLFATMFIDNDANIFTVTLVAPPFFCIFIIDD